MALHRHKKNKALVWAYFYRKNTKIEILVFLGIYFLQRDRKNYAI